MYTLITIALIIVIVVLYLKNRRLGRSQDYVSEELRETLDLLESLNDGLLETNANFEVLRMNKAAERLIGVPASNVIGRKLDLSLAGRDSSSPAVTLARILKPEKEPSLYKPESGGGMLAHAPTYTHDVKLISSEPGKSQTLRVFTMPKVDEHTKQIVGYIKVVRDLKEHPASKSGTVAKTEAYESVVGEKILTPLTGLRFIMRSMLDGSAGPLSPKQAELLQKGDDSAERMIDAVDDILQPIEKP